MKVINWFGLALVCGSIVVTGCQQPASTQNGAKHESHQNGKQPDGGHGKVTASDAEIASALAKLAKEDQALAKAQKKCPVSNELLGSMGAPVKLTIRTELVFLCCSSCNTKALAHADRTLDKVKQFKSENAGASEK